MPRDSKTLGAYFTPEAVAPALVRWAVRDRSCVCGYLFVMRANRAEEVGRDLGVDEEGSFGDRSARKLTENDVALDAHGRPVESIRRFHAPLRELADRRGIRNDVSSYEAIAFALASTEPARAGDIMEEFPEPGGALRFYRFFDSLQISITSRESWREGPHQFLVQPAAGYCSDARSAARAPARMFTSP